jgi:hypothetical protein
MKILIVSADSNNVEEISCYSDEGNRIGSF